MIGQCRGHAAALFLSTNAFSSCSSSVGAGSDVQRMRSKAFHLWCNGSEVRWVQVHHRHCLQDHAGGTGIAHADTMFHGPIFHWTSDLGPRTKEGLEWLILGVVRLLQEFIHCVHDCYQLGLPFSHCAPLKLQAATELPNIPAYHLGLRRPLW